MLIYCPCLGAPPQLSYAELLALFIGVPSQFIYADCLGAPPQLSYAELLALFRCSIPIKLCRFIDLVMVLHPNKLC